MRYVIRTGFWGLALLLSTSLSTAVWADDAALFADLIPGTALTDEELDRIHGRGLNTIGEGTLEAFNGTSLGEFFRERLRKILERSRSGLSSRTIDGLVKTVSGALQNTEGVRDRSRATADQALANAFAIRQRQQDALRARIAEIRSR